MSCLGEVQMLDLRLVSRRCRREHAGLVLDTVLLILHPLSRASLRITSLVLGLSRYRTRRLVVTNKRQSTRSAHWPRKFLWMHQPRCICKFVCRTSMTHCGINFES